MRYPTTKAGIAVPPQELGYDVVLPERRKTSQHHLFFERRMYQDSRLHSVFRGLVSNVYTLPNTQHNELHERYSAPRVPTDTQMIDVVEEYLSLYGVIDVVREKRTHETYQIESGTWQNIKSQYRSGHGVQETYENANGFAYSRP